MSAPPDGGQCPPYYAGHRKFVGWHGQVLLPVRCRKNTGKRVRLPMPPIVLEWMAYYYVGHPNLWGGMGKCSCPCDAGRTRVSEYAYPWPPIVLKWLAYYMCLAGPEL